jgi:hypothetical protein
LAASFANILKLLPMQSAAFGNGMLNCERQTRCCKCYDSIECCNVSNLASCLVWNCITRGTEVGFYQ